MFSVDRLFNARIGANAVATASATGVLDLLHYNGSLDIEQFCRERSFDESVIRLVVYQLAAFDIVTQDEGGRVIPSTLFTDAYKNSGAFHWLEFGYGGLLSRASGLAS